MKKITMPSMGADMKEGVIVKWLVQEGSHISKGDKVAEVETDKTVVEMESYVSGFLKKIVVKEGDSVLVGEVIALIGTADEQLPALETALLSTTAEEEEQNIKQVKTETETKVAKVAEVSSEEQLDTDSKIETDSEKQPPNFVKASPMARNLAKKLDFDINEIKSSGSRIVAQDVISHVPTPKIPTTRQPTIASNNNLKKIEAKRIELTKMRKAIANITKKSKTEQPHFYITTAVDMTEAMKVRSQLNEIYAVEKLKITVNDIILKATVNALVEHPKWNSTFEGDFIQIHEDVNIGIAIALEQGLMVPAILKAQNLTLIEISKNAKELAERTKGNSEQTLTQNELTKATFSTSNLGSFGIDQFTAIIVPPQSAILALGCVKDVVVVEHGKLRIKSVVQITLSADHRVGDGAEAALLVNSVKKNLEKPLLLLE